MPRPPIWLIENLFDVSLYPAHSVTAVGGEASGFPVSNVYDGRRDETRYKGTTANTQVEIRLDCGSVRAANMISLDRGHNLTGKQWFLEISGDNWTTSEVVLDINPHPDVPGGQLDSGFGAVALDGSWARQFPLQLSRYWRVRIPAVASFIPEVTGIYLGRAFQQEKSLPMPYSDFESERFFQELTSLAGRVGRSRTYRRRRGELVVRAGSDNEYLYNFRPWLEDAYRDLSQPGWVILDPDSPSETMVNIICPDQDWAFELDRATWPYPVARIPWIENTPEI